MTKSQGKFLIDVAPIARLPLSRQQFFSYVFNKPLPAGTLVLIPLFRRNIEGIVLDSRPEVQHTGGFQLKKITAVVEESFITTQQLKLAEKISNYYLTSLGTVLRHFMVKRVIARETSNQSPATSNQKAQLITLTSEQQKAVSIVTDNGLPITDYKFLLFGPASSGKTEVYLHSILTLKEQDQNGQFLILLPELTLAPQAIKRYGAYFQTEEIVLLHSKVSKGQLYRSWQKIKSGEAKIIIGTRMALFAPFQNLALIVVDEEQDMSFKQWDMNPRYDARLGADMLSEIFDCPLVFGTSTPRIETFHQTQTGKIKLLELPKLILQDTCLPERQAKYKLRNTKYELIDMRKEKWTDFASKKKPNFSLLSLKLQGEISYALSHKLQTILFVNHQGMSAFSICSNCKTVLRCPKCDRALVYENSGQYKCLHCNYVSGAFPVCSSCKGLEFKNIGIGTQLVQREVKKLFPSARITRLDGTSAKIAKEKEQVFEDFSDKKIDILIGTQMITKGWDNPNVGLVAIIDADSLFTSPDFLTDERAYGNIMQASGRTGRFGATYPGQVLIQTYSPNNKIFDFILNQDYASFFDSQIKQRQALSYPPFGKIIKLFFKDADKAKTEKTSQAVYEKLSDLIS
ncbi:MAG: primosomal protein N', partial [Candidatus Moranbacteria bacterium]|nr:primosomal protein N' [Candidatus Moranbacteria bacterium]